MPRKLPAIPALKNLIFRKTLSIPALLKNIQLVTKFPFGNVFYIFYNRYRKLSLKNICFFNKNSTRVVLLLYA